MLGVGQQLWHYLRVRYVHGIENFYGASVSVPPTTAVWFGGIDVRSSHGLHTDGLHTDDVGADTDPAV